MIGDQAVRPSFLMIRKAIPVASIIGRAGFIFRRHLPAFDGEENVLPPLALVAVANLETEGVEPQLALLFLRAVALQTMVFNEP